MGSEMCIRDRVCLVGGVPGSIAGQGMEMAGQGVDQVTDMARMLFEDTVAAAQAAGEQLGEAELQSIAQDSFQKAKEAVMGAGSSAMGAAGEGMGWLKNQLLGQ